MNGIQNSKFILNEEIKSISELPIDDASQIIIYEVARLIDGKVLFWKDHISRFFRSFKKLNIQPTFNATSITKNISTLIATNQISNGNIKFQVNININTRKQKFIALFIPHAYPSDEQYKNGVRTSVSNICRDTPNAKVQQPTVRNTLNQIIKSEASYEAIMIHPKGFVTEGSRSNLFMIKNEKIYTTPTKDILPGITRKHVIQLCKKLAIPLVQKRISFEELLAMDSLFLTGTSPKILPISSVQNNTFNINHALLRMLMKEFDNYIEEYLRNQKKIF
jgi:branched-chain amino acid aminotransferase